MDVKINPTPCANCPKQAECYTKCPRFDNWFKVSWREVVKPFRKIYEKKKQKEEQESG